MASVLLEMFAIFLCVFYSSENVDGQPTNVAYPIFLACLANHLHPHHV